jgi:hypothetical protein
MTNGVGQCGKMSWLYALALGALWLDVRAQSCTAELRQATDALQPAATEAQVANRAERAGAAPLVISLHEGDLARCASQRMPG